jgi:hypothetical protein
LQREIENSPLEKIHKEFSAIEMIRRKQRFAGNTTIGNALKDFRSCGGI